MAASSLTAVAAEVVAAVAATPDPTAVAKAAPRAAPVTAHATELPRNDGARGRGRAGVTAKTIAFAIAATWVAVATLTTTVAAGETANRQIANARHRTETTAFARAPSVIAAA